VTALDAVTVHLREPLTVPAVRPGSRSVTDLDGSRPKPSDEREGRFCRAHGPDGVRLTVERLTFRHGARDVCPQCAAGLLRSGTLALTVPADLPSLSSTERAALDNLRTAEQQGTAYARALVARGLPPEALSAPQTPAPVPVQVPATPPRPEASQALSAAEDRAGQATALAAVALVLALLGTVLAAVALSI
jgi:hypothetical protein